MPSSDDSATEDDRTKSGSEKDNSDTDGTVEDSQAKLSDDGSTGRSQTEAVSAQKFEKKQVLKPKVKIKTLSIDGQLVYFCKICDKVFTRRKDKLNHELAHSGESVLTCTECGKEYLHESSLASHMRTHSGDQLHMCELCPKMFAQSHHLKTHILSHSEPNDFTCKTCYKEFATALDLKHHNRSEIKREMSQYWCKMCKIYFCQSHNLTLQAFQQLHAFFCSACGELFFSSKKLKLHMKKFAHRSKERLKFVEPLQEHELYPHLGPDSLKKLPLQKSKEIPKRSLSTDSITDPVKKRLGDSNIENLAPARKRLKRSLSYVSSSSSLEDSGPDMKDKEGVRSHFRNKKGKPYCKRCNKSFKDMTDLDYHKAMVHEENPEPASFECESCDFKCSSKEELDSHSLKHKGERMHTCPMCNLEFAHSALLTKHLRSHIEVEDFPYKCITCEKAFRLKIQLIQHIRLHVAQDANTCERCKETFRSGHELQEHLAKGRCNKESYKCHLCSKTFSSHFQLTNHVRLHTNVKSYQCYICHKAFTTKHYLQRHLQIHVRQGMEVNVNKIIIEEKKSRDLDEDLKSDVKGSSAFRNDVKFREKYERDFDWSKSFRQDKGDLGKLNDVDSKKSSDNKSQSLFNGNLNNIKVECIDDTSSEHSSIFARESDSVKYSSDGSVTFKTTMARERRRLRKKYRRSQLAMSPKSSMSSAKEIKQENKEKSEEELSEVKTEAAENESGEEVTQDMVVELNGVVSEVDNSVTVYVNLTKMEKVEKVDQISSLEKGILTNGQSGLNGLDWRSLVDQDGFKLENDLSSFEKSLVLDFSVDCDVENEKGDESLKSPGQNATKAVPVSRSPLGLVQPTRSSSHPSPVNGINPSPSSNVSNSRPSSVSKDASVQMFDVNTRDNENYNLKYSDSRQNMLKQKSSKSAICVNSRPSSSESTLQPQGSNMLDSISPQERLNQLSSMTKSHAVSKTGSAFSPPSRRNHYLPHSSLREPQAGPSPLQQIEQMISDSSVYAPSPILPQGSALPPRSTSSSEKHLMTTSSITSPHTPTHHIKTSHSSERQVITSSQTSQSRNPLGVSQQSTLFYENQTSTSSTKFSSTSSIFSATAQGAPQAQPILPRQLQIRPQTQPLSVKTENLLFSDMAMQYSHPTPALFAPPCSSSIILPPTTTISTSSSSMAFLQSGEIPLSAFGNTVPGLRQMEMPKPEPAPPMLNGLTVTPSPMIDTNNPVLRNMNMMDLVSPQAATPVSLHNSVPSSNNSMTFSNMPASFSSSFSGSFTNSNPTSFPSYSNAMAFSNIQTSFSSNISGPFSNNSSTIFANNPSAPFINSQPPIQITPGFLGTPANQNCLFTPNNLLSAPVADSAAFLQQNQSDLSLVGQANFALESQLAQQQNLSAPILSMNSFLPVNSCPLPSMNSLQFPQTSMALSGMTGQLPNQSFGGIGAMGLNPPNLLSSINPPANLQPDPTAMGLLQNLPNPHFMNNLGLQDNMIIQQNNMIRFGMANPHMFPTGGGNLMDGSINMAAPINFNTPININPALNISFLPNPLPNYPPF